MQKWRDIRWIIAPALFILFVIGLTTWAKAQLQISSQNIFQHFSEPIKNTVSEVYVVYPKQVAYDTEQPAVLELWVVCDASASPCPEKLYLSSKAHPLEFAKSVEPMIWDTVLEVDLPQDHSAVQFQMRKRANDTSSDLDVELFLRIPGSNSLFLPVLRFESQASAKNRIWLGQLLETGGLIISLITAILAGIQKLDEAKKRQRTQEIEQFLAGFGSDAQGKIQQFFLDTLEQLKDWQTWEEPLKTQFRKKHLQLMGGNFVSFLPENINNLQNILRDWRNLCQTTQVDPPDLLNLLGDATNSENPAAQLNGLANLLKKHPDSINIAKVIAQKIDPQTKKDASRLIDKELMSSLPVLGEEFGFLDEKEYPFKSTFGRLSNSPGNILAPDIFASVGLSILPFADAANPFLRYGNEQLFAEKFTPGFRFDYQSTSHENWCWPNEWDMRVAFHEYMRTWPKDKKQTTFIVLLTPELGDEFGWDRPRELFLHALAEQWLSTIFQSLSSFYALKTTRREQLCRLLTWHFGSNIALLARLSSQLEMIDENQRERFIKLVAEITQPHKSSPISAEEVKTFIDVRPRHCQNTIFICLPVSLNLSFEYSISEKQLKSLQQFKTWLSLHQASLVCFDTGEAGDNHRRSETDLEQWCNLRLRVCSDGVIDGLDLLFTPHDGEPAEKILARKAKGSPGLLVRLGNQLFDDHLHNFPTVPEFDIQEVKKL